MEGLLGDDYLAFVACYDQPAHTGLRVNTLKLNPEAFLLLSPFPLSPVSWCPAGFCIPPDSRPGRHPYHAAGLYYLQEPSAMAVAEVLDPQPGERVLDLAASPGGKTTHIAALMQNQGLLIANEIRTKRIPALLSNLERWGARNAVVVNESPERLAERLPAYFDRLLVDAPCSGEGMFRKDETARAEWDAAAIPGYAERQRRILAIAARLVRPGGVLVYSTCTFAPAENEGVIDHFLKANGDFSLDPQPRPAPGFSPAHPEWGEADTSHPWAGAARIWPHLSPGEGHFLARLRRTDGSQPSMPASNYKASFPKSAIPFIKAFFDEHVTNPQAASLPIPDLLTAEHLLLRGLNVYLQTFPSPDITSLRVPAPAWRIGVLRKDRFEPGHALAMALPADAFCRVLNLPAGSFEVRAYLRGETLQSPGEGGWTLVAVDGFPLGWGKRVRGVVKNHYPVAIRAGS